MTLRRDVSGFDVRLTDEMIAGKSASGVWANRTIVDHAAERIREDPDALVLIDGELELTRRQIWEAARRFGATLRRLGLAPGNVIACQLPNWHEATVVHLAAAIEGFVINPIVPIYRDAEVKFILGEARARAFVITDRFRKFDYAAMVRRVRGDLPLLDHVIVVRGDAGEFTPYQAFIETAAAGDAGSVDPNAVKMLMYTSGTTGPAKGVLHSHNAILAEIDHYRDFWGVGPSDMIFMPSSICHISGLNWAVETPWALGAPAILVEHWQADAAVEIMARRHATVFIGPTVFLQEMLDAAKRVGTTLPDLRLYLCGGASVPPELVRRAHRELPHCLTARVFGSTECPSVTYGVLLDDDRDHAATTDGRIVHWDVKIVDPETGRPLRAEQDGEILVRGDEMLIGYSRVEDTIAAFDEEGYFRTGDIGRVVDGSYLLITDRKKDIIIRGGENISSREIEDALQLMPCLGPVAIVAMPCPRMGETVCLYVERRGDVAATKEEILAFLRAAGIARQKLPERIEMIDELPRNPSGKIRKDVLRRQIAAMVAAEQQSP